jgi:hypothetical protein
MKGTEAIAEAVKIFTDLAVKPLLAVALASGAVVFAPEPWITKLGMASFVADYRSWLGLAFVVSCAYLLAHAAVFVAITLRGRYEDWATRRAQLNCLKTLAPDEKARLVPYIRNQRSSVDYPITDGVVRGLVAKGILFRSSEVGYPNRFAFNIQPWVRTEIEKDPSLLDGAESGALRPP